jgi:Na+-transporting methylmalonyl-CoA/oxaloacetate decarboxylase gamma subunit
MEFVTLWDGVKLSLIGMGSVFAVLALLGFILSLFRWIFYRPQSETSPKSAEGVATPVVVDPRQKKRKAAAVMAAVTAILDQETRTETEASSETPVSKPRRKAFKIIKMERWNHD